MKITSLAAFIFLLAIEAKSQISATIADSKTKAPIEGASISIQKENDTAFAKKVASQKSGYFTFIGLENDKYVLTISHIGYSTHRTIILIKNNNIPQALDTIWLRVEDKELNGINVISKKPPLEFNGSRIILNVTESPVMSSGSVYDAIMRVPGILELNSTLKFRGKGVLVLIDNKQVFLKDEDLKDVLSNMPASNIEKIEVLPTPPSNYDGEAQSVINIKTIKNKSYGMNGILTLGGGMGVNGRYNAGANINYKKKWFNLYGNYNYEHSNTFFNVDVAHSLDAGQQIFENGHEVRIRNNNLYRIGIDFTPSKSITLGILFSGFNNKRERVDENNVINSYLGQPIDSLTQVKWSGIGKYINSSSNLYLKKLIDTSGQALSINGDYVHYSKNLYDNYTTDNLLSNGQHFLPTSQLRDTSLGLSKVYSISVDYTRPFKNGHADFGLKSTFTENDNNLLWQSLNANKWLIDSLLTQNNRYNENIYAAYALFGKKTERYEISGGLRFEQTHLKLENSQANPTNVDFGSFLPNINVEYKKDDNTIYSISYRKSVQRPTFRDLSPWINYYSSYSYYTGNPNLRPEYDNDFNVSYSYKNKLTVGLEYMHSTDVLLPFITKGSDNALFYGMENIPFYNLFGVSVNYNKQVNKIWWFNFSNTLQYLTYSQKIQNGLNNTGLTYAGDLKNTFTFKKGWSSEVYGNFNSAAPFGIYRLNNAFLSGIGAGMQKSFWAGSGKLAFSATDILNTSTQKYSTDFDGVVLKKNDKVESRFFRVVFTYKLGNKNVKNRAERKNNIDDIKSRL